MKKLLSLEINIPMPFHLATSITKFPTHSLPQCQVYSLAEQNRYYKKAAGYCLRAVAKHSPQLAQAVIDSGALDSLVTCLEEFDPGVKESAAWCLGFIAGHNTELAQQVVDAGDQGLPLLCLASIGQGRQIIQGFCELRGCTDPEGS